MPHNDQARCRAGPSIGLRCMLGYSINPGAALTSL
jgi:hypothetical protein